MSFISAMNAKGFQFLIVIIWASSLVLTALGQSSQKVTTTTPKQAVIIDDEAYAVYSALLQSLYASDAKLLVIDDYVSGCVPVGKNSEGENAWQQSLNSLPGKMPKLSPNTVADFKRQARQCRNLEAKFTLSTKYLLISKQERKQIFAKPDTKKAWELFYQKYAGASGYIDLSNIGFNEDHTQALVDTYRKCGAKCGGEKMVFLIKVNGLWSLASTYKIWEL